VTVRITREQYAKDLVRLAKPDPLEIDPIEFIEYKKMLKYRFMLYVPEQYKKDTMVNTLDKIFDQLVAIAPTFTRNDVVEATRRLITL
jgi:hypothetical protein